MIGTLNGGKLDINLSFLKTQFSICPFALAYLCLHSLSIDLLETQLQKKEEGEKKKQALRLGIELPIMIMLHCIQLHFCSYIILVVAFSAPGHVLSPEELSLISMALARHTNC